MWQRSNISIFGKMNSVFDQTKLAWTWFSMGCHPRLDNLDYDTPTDDVTVHEEESAFLGSSWEPTSWVSNPRNIPVAGCKATQFVE